MLNSAWVTESWSSRARCARSWLAASSAAWSRRSPSSRSRSLMSRTEPWAPANRPSTIVPVIATSVWLLSRPAEGRSRRKRCSRSGSACKSSNAAIAGPSSAFGSDDGEGRPSSCSGFQPVRDSSESLKKVKLPSASTLHTMSGELSTRCRYRRSDSSTSAYRRALVRAMAAWSASSFSSSASSASNAFVRGRLHGDRADQAVRAEERRRHHRVDVLRLDARVALVVRERPGRRGSRRSSTRASRPRPCRRSPIRAAPSRHPARAASAPR